MDWNWKQGSRCRKAPQQPTTTAPPKSALRLSAFSRRGGEGTIPTSMMVSAPLGACVLHHAAEVDGTAAEVMLKADLHALRAERFIGAGAGATRTGEKPEHEVRDAGRISSDVPRGVADVRVRHRPEAARERVD